MATGYFTDDSMLRRVVSERVMVLAGGRTLLMQAAHPVAWAGFFAHTGALDEPYERLNRTAAVLNAIGFGTRAEADRLTRRVRAMHRRVRGGLREPAGRFPAGTPYAADDPELLLWILATLVDSALTVYPRYVRALSWAERDALWRDYKVVGNLFGLADADMPDGIDEFDAYMRGMLEGGDLLVVPEARDLGVRIVMKPPVPLAFKPLLELVNQITVGLLPASIRRQYGFSWDPARHLALLGGAEYPKGVLLPLLPEKLRVIQPAAA
jgi:uncharacterized protein (DUF2236 family)